ncbi:CDP-alcohol phosphatidyltransferase family protein [Candidatus Thorarchaeota archaeon]|nr:MAG: CDP-alcohol phosphatidyltransferase family protein [Candidatus Thorarchaeota archaeon]
MSPSRFRLRRVFKRPITRLAVPLASRGVKPNTVTYISLLVAILSFIILLLVGSQPGFAVAIFIVGVLDGLDGAIARLSGRSSDMGAFLDSVIDKVSEGIILLSIALHLQGVELFGLQIEVWVSLSIMGWLLTSYTRARAENLGVKDLDVGLGARSERIFTLFLFGLVSRLDWGIIIVAMMGLCTAGYRYYHYTRELEEYEKTDQ